MTEIYVEVKPKHGMRGDLGSFPGKENLKERINDLTEAINEIGIGIKKNIAELFREEQAGRTYALGEVEIGFSLELEAQTGLIVSQLTGRAGFEITLTFERNRQ